MSTSEERGRIAKEHKLDAEAIRDLARCLKAKGYSNSATAHILRIPENDVRVLAPVPMPRSEVAQVIRLRDLSKTDQFEINGPWGFKALEGLESPIYIFLPGGEKKIIGKAIVNIQHGLKFEIELEEQYKDIETAAFEVPMRFTMRQKKQTQTEGE